jgi:hypothetical protein
VIIDRPGCPDAYDYFGHYGLYFITIPAIIGFAYGLNHFINLEKEAGRFPGKKVSLDSPEV